jgi:hypothetical protein
VPFLVESAPEVFSFDRDAVWELGVSPLHHSWQETVQGESSLFNCCGLCCKLCGVVFVSCSLFDVVPAFLAFLL